jgi:hypothetical protein
MPVESYHSETSFVSPSAFSRALRWDAVSRAAHRIHFSMVYRNTDWSRGWPKALRMPRISTGTGTNVGQCDVLARGAGAFASITMVEI